MNKIIKMLAQIKGMMSKIPASVISLLARFIMASIFWKSAMTKIAFTEGGLKEFSLSQVWNVVTLKWTVTSGTYSLFKYEYNLPVLPSDWAAHMALTAEILLPMALIFGLFTRFAALAMLAMTLVIQIFVYPNLWTVHGLWSIALIFLMARGAGWLSLDNLLCKKIL